MNAKDLVKLLQPAVGLFLEKNNIAATVLAVEYLPPAMRADPQGDVLLRCLPDPESPQRPKGWSMPAARTTAVTWSRIEARHGTHTEIRLTVSYVSTTGEDKQLDLVFTGSQADIETAMAMAPNVGALANPEEPQP